MTTRSRSSGSADFVDRQVKAAVDGLFAPETPSDFLRLLRKRVPGLSPAEIRASLGRARVNVDYPVVQTPLRRLRRRRQSRRQWCLPNKHRPASRRPHRRTTRRPGASVTMEELIASGQLRPPLDLETTYKGNGSRHASRPMAA